MARYLVSPARRSIRAKYLVMAAPGIHPYWCGQKANLDKQPELTFLPWSRKDGARFQICGEALESCDVATKKGEAGEGIPSFAQLEEEKIAEFLPEEDPTQIQKWTHSSLAGTEAARISVAGISKSLDLSSTPDNNGKESRDTRLPSLLVANARTLLPHLQSRFAHSPDLHDSTPTAFRDGQKRCNVTAPLRLCQSWILFLRQSLIAFPPVHPSTTLLVRDLLAPPPSSWDLQTIFDYSLFWHLAATQTSMPPCQRQPTPFPLNAGHLHPRGFLSSFQPCQTSPLTVTRCPSRPSPEILGFGTFDSPKTNMSDINLRHSFGASFPMSSLTVIQGELGQDLLASPRFPNNPAGSGWSLRVPMCHGSCQFQAQTSRHYTTMLIYSYMGAMWMERRTRLASDNPRIMKNQADGIAKYVRLLSTCIHHDASTLSSRVSTDCKPSEIQVRGTYPVLSGSVHERRSLSCLASSHYRDPMEEAFIKHLLGDWPASPVRLRMSLNPASPNLCGLG
ncbi:uncharacterized protein CLUP02_15765 [Colletotrichum lupini]|uniref:Uncharacterized protein n=1 Tax=Colletotrichum lupini TaxID=145971 RepID=A0A9Q8T7I1_9PEZI|nr:uncharacterized protein CLUP02_15765 [Colletotrichum lupini]UQC90235.1 hypothetical protein CLUP02_15765 [Colletotrichum lupini]